MSLLTTLLLYGRGRSELKNSRTQKSLIALSKQIGMKQKNVESDRFSKARRRKMGKDDFYDLSKKSLEVATFLAVEFKDCNFQYVTTFYYCGWLGRPWHSRWDKKAKLCVWRNSCLNIQTTLRCELNKYWEEKGRENCLFLTHFDCFLGGWWQ